MENNLYLLTVNNLCQYSFYIPAYQRGYRWTSQEVKDLLNDIDEFRPREIQDSDDKTWYCLQPLVVKNISTNRFEVIDGQQRLTTVYLILHYLNQDFVEARRDKLFEIDYETRENTKEFLKDPSKRDNSNIDFYYISTAYHVIEDWFSKKDSDFDQGAFRSKLKFNTKFIWYETSEKNSIPVFARLNIGKISLTNSELIKALFLNSSNYSKEDDKGMHLRQIEIAAEWDNIENGLQNDKLWYFINESKKPNNRIEFIFDLMANEINKDSYATFRFFSKRMGLKTQQIINDNWQEVKTYSQRFSEWYNEREWYHKIGFILNVKISKIEDLYNASTCMKKNNFSSYLDELIKDYFKKIKLSELQYNDSKTKSVLLLYNILTMLQNKQDDSYFPFNTYKLDKWDIEHIASIKDSIPDKNERNQWIHDVKPYIDTSLPGGEKLKENLSSCNYLDDDKFSKLFNEVDEHFNQFINIDDINGISNLTLLDSFTNRSYKNAVFPIKRKTIIDRDKSGVFIPLCTKNVFLKYFSDYPPKISFWAQDDREKYEEDLFTVLGKYLEV